MRTYYVYIMSNKSKTLYVGDTNNLVRRVEDHKRGIGSWFTHWYRINMLVYYEEGSNVEDAIYREKEIKGWRRARKLALIEEVNPDWVDLSEGWFS